MLCISAAPPYTHPRVALYASSIPVEREVLGLRWLCAEFAILPILFSTRVLRMYKERTQRSMRMRTPKGKLIPRGMTPKQTPAGAPCLPKQSKASKENAARDFGASKLGEHSKHAGRVVGGCRKMNVGYDIICHRITTCSLLAVGFVGDV